MEKEPYEGQPYNLYLMDPGFVIVPIMLSLLAVVFGIMGIFLDLSLLSGTVLLGTIAVFFFWAIVRYKKNGGFIKS